MNDPITTIETATNTVNVISLLLDSLINFVPKLIAFCSIAAALTPRPDPKSKWYPFLKPLDVIINHIAFNVKNARNSQ